MSYTVILKGPANSKAFAVLPCEMYCYFFYKFDICKIVYRSD